MAEGLTTTAAATPALAISSIEVVYNHTVQALRGLSIGVPDGKVVALLGSNGAGKTTMISILAGLTRASAGKVTVLGSDVQADYAQARSKLGVVPQELVFDPFFNVREALRIQSGYFGVKNNEA